MQGCAAVALLQPGAGLLLEGLLYGGGVQQQYGRRDFLCACQDRFGRRRANDYEGAASVRVKTMRACG